MTDKELKLKQRLFKIIYELDKGRIRKDYDALALLHYDNIFWLYDNSLIREYLNYFSDRFESER